MRGIDKDADARKRVLEKLRRMKPREAFDLAVRAGIYSRSGELTERYRDAEADVQANTETEEAVVGRTHG